MGSPSKKIDPISPPFQTKAGALLYLRDKVKRSHIEDIWLFSVSDFERDPERVIRKITERFQSERLVIRSTAKSEDSKESSLAGYFHSEVGVQRTDRDSLYRSVANVIGSYKKLGQNISDEQVLVQPHTENLKMSGVVFTRQIETNAPYYTVNYHEGSDTTRVTSGQSSHLTFFSRFIDSTLPKHWNNLLQAVKEIENIIEGPLDIEFGIQETDAVVVFQVRPLAINKDLKETDPKIARQLVADLQSKFRRLSLRVPHLAGGKTVFGDMPDWNPAEILGDRPNTLDYTLYRFIITDKVWHDARATLGYMDVYPAELITSFGKKPYVDARISFNSFTPQDIPQDLREKLVNYYLEELEKHPEKQDKVEFEILWTCYSFTLEEQLDGLKSRGFMAKEIATLNRELFKLTDNVLRNSETLFRNDLRATDTLAARLQSCQERLNTDRKITPWEVLNVCHYTLQNCKKFGTFPFSRLARMAFIAKELLFSLRKKEVVGPEFFDAFLTSITTVAGNFKDDLSAVQAGRLTRDRFLARYGHLRLGTYDITAPRYSDIIGHLLNSSSSACDLPPKMEFSPPKSVIRSISAIMKEHDLWGDADSLLHFMRQALANRELSKLEFTKSLSFSIEAIARAGELLGFSREELSQVDVHTLMKLRNPEVSDEKYAKKIIAESITRHRKEKEWYAQIVLPPVLTNEEDFICMRFPKSRPNFITNKTIKGRLIPFDRTKPIAEHAIEGNIVLIENADPGYDWIFSRSPSGLVTKYGGMASHMAIRCAEFGLPAAIGCGEAVYDGLIGKKFLLLDCQKKIIEFF